MKKILGALVIALFAVGANAQVFEKGSSIVTAQLGIGGGFGQRVAYEYSLVELLNGKASIGVGGSLNNRFYSDKIKNEYGKEKWGYNTFTVTAIGSFHYEFVDKLDTYLTVGVGGGAYTSTHKVNFANSAEKEYGVEDFKESASIGCFNWVSSIGARYYFTDKWAANAELGWTGANYFAIGATYKF